MFKKIISFFLILSLYSCGYTSIYNDLNNTDINIEIGKVEGDKNINDYLKRNFRKFSNEENNEIYILDIKSFYDKKIASKDSTGQTTDYKIEISIEFLIQKNEKTEIVTYTESINLTKMEDLFEEQKYERTLKENFASSVSKKIIQRLSLFK